jgi:hypothetical protein
LEAEKEAAEEKAREEAEEKASKESEVNGEGKEDDKDEKPPANNETTFAPKESDDYDQEQPKEPDNFKEPESLPALPVRPERKEDTQPPDEERGR